MTRQKILSRFKELGITPTPQRLEIASILLRKPQHVSAEQVVNRLRARKRKAVKATVYNCLNLFAKKGLIKECLIDPERRLFDSSTNPHHHFYNVDTGELTDIPGDEVEILGLPALPPGTECDGVELIIRVRSSEE